MAVDKSIFKSLGGSARRHVVLRDLPDFGLKAGAEVSRRQAEKLSNLLRVTSLPSLSPQGLVRSTGKFTIDPLLFGRAKQGPFARGYQALIDLPQFGIRAGDFVSRRKAIQASQGGESLEKLTRPLEMNKRREYLLQLWMERYGNKRRFRKFIEEMDAVHSTLARGLPPGRTKETAEGWANVMKKFDLWDTYQKHRNDPEGRGTWESDVLEEFDLESLEFGEGVVMGEM